MVEKKVRNKINHTREVRAKQKENLKTLVENSSGGKLRTAGRVVKYGAASFSRNIWLSIAATLVMTITLVILLVTVGASLILNSTAEAMRQKIDITIFFRPGTELAVLENMSDMVKTDENVRSVEVADSAMEYQKFLEENADNTDLIAALEDEEMNQMMLNTMQATMRLKVYDPENLDSLKNIVNTTEIFQQNLDPEKEPTYDVNKAEIATINSWANVAKNGGLILGAVFLVISILMIFNTIRMAIFSRREEIYMMKLVGADSGFIRGPFLVEAQICGVISGICASTLAYCGYAFLAPKLSAYGIDISSVEMFMTTSKLVIVYLVVIGVGMLIGLISARLALHKYLK